MVVESDANLMDAANLQLGVRVCVQLMGVAVDVLLTAAISPLSLLRSSVSNMVVARNVHTLVAKR
jgi:hypothetical protein